MTKPTLRERHVFWWMCYANQSFIRARAICLAKKEHPYLQLELQPGLIAMYCRPFTGTQTLLGDDFKGLRDGLIDKLVPAEFKNLHLHFIELHHKHFCHVDGANYKDDAFGDINKVLLKKENGAVQLKTLTIGIDFESATRLCSALIDNTYDEIQDHCKRWGLLGLDDGAYELNLNEEKMPLFRPFRI
jgi:hypothetical protein